MAAINKKVLLLPILRRRLQQAKEKRTSRFWVRDIYKLRKERGEFHCLVKEAALFDHEYFFLCSLVDDQNYRSGIHSLGYSVNQNLHYQKWDTAFNDL